MGMSFEPNFGIDQKTNILDFPPFNNKKKQAAHPSVFVLLKWAFHLCLSPIFPLNDAIQEDGRGSIFGGTNNLVGLREI